MTRGELFAAKMASVESESRIARRRGAPRLENWRGIRERMKNHDSFWKLEALSDRQLLERLGSVLGSSRRLTAELIAHLGEVEERRLHLAAACSSMFAYCLKLGMTEDEAYRRIEVARLARSYPGIFPLLAAGQLTISVVALLKHHLSRENHQELLAAVTGKSVVQARELIAERFPRPDVPTSVRKLPERRTMTPLSLTLSMSGEPRTAEREPCAPGMKPCVAEPEPRTPGTEPRVAETEPTPGTEPRTSATQQSHSGRAAPPRVSSRVEPLSAQRYKVQFTASAELARKIELARDLMRHCHPGGELGPVVERALDLLIESLMQRRFGQSKKTSPRRRRERANLEQDRAVMGNLLPMQHTAPSGRAELAPATDTPAPPAPRPAEPATPAAELLTPKLDAPATPKLDAPATPAAELPAPKLDAPATAEPETHATAEPDTPTLTDRAAHGMGMHDDTAEPNLPTTLGAAGVEGAGRADAERASTSRYISRFSRGTVVERDGLGCSWVDEQGARCGARAWLEYDHRHPRAKGGDSEPGNLRLLCRQHNRFAAEREYGRRHVEKHIAARRRGHAPHAI